MAWSQGGKLRTQLEFSTPNFLSLSVEANVLNQNLVCVCDRISFVYCEKFVFKGEKLKNGKCHQANTEKLAPERY